MHAIQPLRGRTRVLVALITAAVGSVGIVDAVSAGPCGLDQEVRIGGVTQCVHIDTRAELGRALAPTVAQLTDGDTDVVTARHTALATARADTAAVDPDPSQLQLVCDRSTTSRRVEVLYAHTAGNDDLSNRIAELRDHVRFAQLQYDYSAFVAGSERSFLPRFVTTGTGDDCRIKVTRVRISETAVTDVNAFFDELFDAGFDDPNRAYLTFVEEGPYCGLGTIIPNNDDPDPAANPNNTRVHGFDGQTPILQPAYTRIDEGCWGFAEAHELGHNLGAVQFSAPHSTSGSHCTDGLDVMCYDDGFAGSQFYGESTCPADDPTFFYEFSLDCNNDDYYDPTGPTSGYLANHWNIVDNDWLFETFTDAALVGLTVGPTGTRFDDVELEATFMRDIDALAEAGVTRGCNPPANTRFCPSSSVTRGQMAAFLRRALGLPAGTATFEDVPADSVFVEDIAALAEAGITRGCNPPANTRFCPDRPVTRGQMAAFLRRALGLPAGTSTFEDVPADHDFVEDIAALAEAGITKGCNPPTNTRFCPDRSVTREQMAAFLRRAGLL